MNVRFCARSFDADELTYVNAYITCVAVFVRVLALTHVPHVVDVGKLLVNYATGS